MRKPHHDISTLSVQTQTSSEKTKLAPLDSREDEIFETERMAEGKSKKESFPFNMEKITSRHLFLKCQYPSLELSQYQVLIQDVLSKLLTETAHTSILAYTARRIPMRNCCESVLRPLDATPIHINGNDYS